MLFKNNEKQQIRQNNVPLSAKKTENDSRVEETLSFSVVCQFFICVTHIQIILAAIPHLNAVDKATIIAYLEDDRIIMTDLAAEWVRSDYDMENKK